MTAYLIGCLAQVPFANVAFYEGPLAKAPGGGDISWTVGIPISAACYLVLVRIWRPALSAARPGQAALAEHGISARRDGP